MAPFNGRICRWAGAAWHRRSTDRRLSSRRIGRLESRPSRPNRQPAEAPPFNRGRAISGLLLALALLSVASAQSQRPMPRIGYVYPAGGQQGTAFTVSVGGRNLDRASAGYLSGSGGHVKVIGYERPLTQQEINQLREEGQQLQDKRAAAGADPLKPRFSSDDERRGEEIRHALATRGNRQATPAVAETVTLEIALAAGVAPGEWELRLKTPNGLSNPLVFHVGQLPEVSAPAVIATSARAPSAPRNRLAGSRGANAPSEMEVTLPALVNGQILPGEVDRFTFAARKGQRLTLVSSARALLPYLADAVPGWFQATLALYDTAGRELAYEDDFQFSPDPMLSCLIPEDGVYRVEIKDALYRGREDFVYRIAIGELPVVTALFPLGGIVGSRVTLGVTGWNLAGNSIDLDTSDKNPGTFLLSVRNSGILSNPVRFHLDPQPDCLAVEPNDSLETAQRLALPMIVNGRIERGGDEDVFAFTGKAGDEIVAEVLARRLGSPLDSILTLTDASGRPIARNDDHNDKAAGLLTHQADSRLSFTLPADGMYYLRIVDAQHRGGPEFGYRLRVGAPRPDFELRVVPSTLNVRAGTAVPITVYALRRDGFSGDIVVGLRDAPRGFALSGARIPAGVESVPVTMSALLQPRDEPWNLSLVGLATIGGKPVAHAAVPADDMMQAFAYPHLVPARELKVNVAGRGATFRLATAGPVKIKAGGPTRIRVSTTAGRAAGKIQLELSEPPSGLAIERCSSRGETIEVVLTCDPTQAKPGVRGNLLFVAYAERANSTAKKGSAKQGQRWPLGVVPAIPFEIVAAGDPGI